MNKLYEKIMNGANVNEKTMNKLCDWIDSNINDDYLTENDAKVEKYEKMKNDLNNTLVICGGKNIFFLNQVRKLTWFFY